MKPLVSVVIATYNEVLNLAPLVDDVHQALSDIPHEVIVVDDDSPDKTWQRVEELQTTRPWLRLIRRIGERGLSKAVLRGFSEAQGSILGVMDGDGSHDESILPNLVKAIQDGAELAIGSRRIPGGGATNWPWPRRLSSTVATALSQAILQVELSDPMSGYFFVSRNFYDRCKEAMQAKGYKIMLEMYCLGHPRRVQEIAFIFRNRRQGQSKISLSVLWDFLTLLLVQRRAVFREPAACPLCGQAERPSMIKSYYPIYRCPGCGVLFVGAQALNLPPQEVYGKNYYDWIKDDLETARQIKSATFAPWLKRLQHWVKPGRLLEIGSAYGFFLDEAKSQGWEVWGVEISNHARDFANAVSGATRTFPTFRDLPPDARRFQAIALCDVIEHFYEPAEVLPQLHALLAEGGVLMITTPNTQSLFAKAMGRAWFHIKPLEHPILFSSKALWALLSRHGFTILESRRAVKKMTLAYVQSQFKVYRFPFYAILCRLLDRLPQRWLTKSFSIYSGEMLVFARRNKERL